LGSEAFPFQNHWLLHSDFKALVEGWWRSQSLSGWMGFILKEKLKGLKGVIKSWNKNVYGAVDNRIRLLVEDINNADVKGELVALSETEVSKRKQNFVDLWHLLRSKESMLVQRSRANWLKEGVKARGSGNSIRAIQVGGEWIDSPGLIRQATVDFFKGQFCHVMWN
jgi:hypothetical protein